MGESGDGQGGAVGQASASGLEGRWYIAAVVLTLAALAMSGYLGWVHLEVNYFGEKAGGLCDLSRRVNCNVVAASDFAYIAGIPVSLLGFALYLGTLVALLVGKASAFAGRWLPKALTVVFGGAVLYSVFLGSVSGFVLRAFCWGCATLYVLNVLLWVAARAMSGLGAFGALRSVLGSSKDAVTSPAVVALSAVFVATVGAGVIGLERVPVDVAWVKALKPVPADVWSMMVQGEHGLGAEKPVVTVVEMSDFECPYCARMSPTVKRLLDDYPDQVRIYFKQYPLDQACNPKLTRPFHRHACTAAKANLCAGLQGKFWPMHDRLFATRKLKPEDMAGHAEVLGLDAKALETCMQGEAVDVALQNDMQIAREAGVRGTPAIFVEGRQVGGAMSYGKLRAAVEHFLNPANQGGVVGP